MTDAFGREIYYLRLSVTERCNLRCRYCMPADGICKKSHEEMLTEDEMILAVEAAAALGFKKLRITGGEPLVKKNLLSICSRAAAVDGIEEICLTTNGTLLPHLAKEQMQKTMSEGLTGEQLNILIGCQMFPDEKVCEVAAVHADNSAVNQGLFNGFQPVFTSHD